MDQREDSGARALIAALFFLSGACGLIYQVLWVRMLVLVFGTTVHAVSTVLAAFMAGLALGSLYFGRKVDRSGRGLLIYAWLETLVGLFALVFLALLPWIDELCTTVYQGVGERGYLFAAFRFAITFGVLLVPTTLMGGTLPVLTRFAARRLATVGRTVGTLYAINTFGAVVGVAVVAFVLMEFVGVRGTTFIAAGTNLIIGAVCFVLHSRVAEPRPRAAALAPEEAVPVDVASTVLSPPAARAVFWGFALSGFAALGYEVVWTRLLSTVLHITTTQSLSTMLIVFLFGLAAGGAVGARFVDRGRSLTTVFGIAQLALGLCGLASIMIFGVLPDLVSAIGPVFTWWGHLARLFVAAFAVMLVPTLLMGLLFPVAGRIHVLGLASVGSRIGSVYAVNTAGALFGAFATGFVLLPLFGTQGSILVLASINVAVGITVLSLDRGARAVSRLAWSGAFVVSIVVLLAVLPSTALVDLYAGKGGELLYHDEGAAGTVTVIGYPDGRRLLRVNGAGEVPTDRASIQTFRLLGTLPLVLHEDPEEVMVIAFGGGITLAAVEQQQPRRIDCVEIVSGVPRAAPFFADHNRGISERLHTGPIRLIVNDGRNHVRRTGRRYDVIISDSTHPSTADSWVLYTSDFYSLCRDRLKSGGMMAQWLPLHGLAPEDYKMVVRTFASVFPHTTVWLTTHYSVLLGTAEPLSIDLERLQRRLEPLTVRVSLGEVGLGDPVSLIATLALDEAAVSSYVGPGPINTDDRPYVNFRDRLRTNTAHGTPALVTLLPYLVDRTPVPVVGADRETLDRMDRRFLSRNHMVSGVIAVRLGDWKRASEQLKQARRLDPTEHEALEVLQALQRASPN